MTNQINPVLIKNRVTIGIVNVKGCS